MDLFLYTLNGIAPVFLVIFIGIILNKLNFFSEKTKDEIVKLVFYVGTPCLIFSSVSEADLTKVFRVDFLAFTVIAIVSFLFLSILLSFWIKDKKKKGAVVQIAFRSNFAIIGMPIAMNLMDKEGIALTAVALSFAVITFNISAVILLSYYGNSKKQNILLGIIKNPLIIGTVLGLIFAIFKISVPSKKTIDMLGSIASSMGLLIIGATITLKGFLDNSKYILFSVFLRNVLAPVLFIFSGVLLGYRGNFLMVLAILSSSPAAVNCFVMAKNMGVDSDISAYGVSITSIMSLFSVFLSVYVIKLLGLA